MERFRLIAVAAWLPILGGAVLANALEGPARVAAVVVVVVAVILQLFAGRKALHLQRRLPGWNPY